MSERTEFDDLAQHKLEEQQPAFRESDWQAAERMIAAQHKTGGGWRNVRIAMLVLLLTGSAAWYLNRDIGTSIAQTLEAVSLPAVAPVVTEGDNETTTQPNIGDPSNTSTGERAVQGTAQAPVAQEIPKATPMDRSGSNPPVQGASSAQKASNTKRASKPTTAHNAPKGASLSGSAQEALQDMDPSDEHAYSEGIMTGEHPYQEDPSGSSTSASGPIAVAAYPVSIAPINTPDILAPDQKNAFLSGIPEGRDIGISDVPPDVTPEVDNKSLAGLAQVNTDNNARVGDPSSTETIDNPSIVAPSLTPEGYDNSLPGVSQVNTPEGNANDTLASTSPQDSTTAVVPPLAPLPVTAASPWEIGVLFGGLRSTSKYSGGKSAEWNGGLNGRWSTAFGAEVMHMGRNFGIGSGVHLATYEEELTVEARSLTTTVIRDSNYFHPVDTTILHVLGNVVIDGQEWYVTESRDTTINILILGTRTFTSTRQLIDALRVVNRMSYVEIPLLLDAHLTQGPWMLGLRGGPTIGVLTGRRGTLPNADFDGYAPFTTEQFHTMVIGLTARAYIRYRLSQGWSVGIEPTWRGQLNNAFSSGDVVRKNSGVGGMFSVTYRLK